MTVPSASSTRSQSGSSSSLRSHERISSASTVRSAPNASSNSAATRSASSTRSRLRSDELIERLRQREQIRQLACGSRVVGSDLAEPVHPHAAQTESRRRDDVVEQRRTHVHVAFLPRPRTREELLPVPGSWFVRTDLLRNDHLVEGDP